MKKLYRIFLLLIVFTILSTYTSNQDNFTNGKDNIFFKINNIEVVNNILVKENEIKEKLNKIYQENIFLVDSQDIEKPLKEIDFLDKIEVKKKYPNTIIVKIYETKPLAILFRDKKKYIIDSSSSLISLKQKKNFDELPTVFGKNAENYFEDFFQRLKKNNFPEKKIRNFYYFPIGRWDLQLVNDKVIKLPSSKVDDAIIKAIELLDRKDFENYNTIDLRVNGKIIVE
tara:strand:+ start:899 stop:1582 length:684 start_codon:yes stop_codon:yes gene_type:complete